MTPAALTLDASPETMPSRTPSRPRQPKPRTNSTPHRVVLAGFMGSGKSTIGRLLAAELGWDFLDLDAEIERRCGLSVPDIFSQLGEPHFRRQEAAALASILGRSRTVIALGGGAPEDLGNQLLLEQTPSTAVVFLTAPFTTLLDRCRQQANAVRPLLADRTLAEKRFRDRQRIYARIATHTLDTSTLEPAEVTSTLIRDLAL